MWERRMKEIVFSVNGGGHDRTYTPLVFSLEKQKIGEEVKDAYILDMETNEVLPVQFSTEGSYVSFAFLVPSLRSFESRRYKLLINKGCNIEYVNVMSVEDDGSEVKVFSGDFHVLSYKYANVVKPYIYPVRAPNGVSITDNGPKDHIHHRSLYVAHGDVNGVDIWSEQPGHGFIKHKKFQKVVSGPVYTEIEALNVWTDKDGNPLLDEHRKVKVWNIPSREWLIDFEISLEASYSDVKFGDTKEGGILSVRVAPTMTVDSGYGKLVNSWGGINEKEVWGKRAMWCDYIGMLKNEIFGIAVFDHYKNFRYPTYWHARDYGLMTANMFGWSYFTGDKSICGDYLLEKGKSLNFKYRVYVHKGDHITAKVNSKFISFIYPPTITIET